MASGAFSSRIRQKERELPAPVFSIFAVEVRCKKISFLSVNAARTCQASAAATYRQKQGPPQQKRGQIISPQQV